MKITLAGKDELFLYEHFSTTWKLRQKRRERRRRREQFGIKTCRWKEASNVKERKFLWKPFHSSGGEFIG